MKRIFLPVYAIVTSFILFCTLVVWIASRVTPIYIAESDSPGVYYENSGIEATIDNAREAAFLGEAALRAKLGDGVRHNRPFHVTYDDKKGCWLVKGTSSLLRTVLGGFSNPVAVIDRKDGAIISVYCSQD